MPDLASLPSDTRVFVDTIIFDLQYRGKSTTCNAFLERIARREVEAYVNTQVLSDPLHKLMLEEAVQKGLIARRRASELRACFNGDRGLSERLTDYQAHFENTLSIGIHAFQVTKKLLVDSKHERRTHGLPTDDSLHLACLWRQGIRDIVTHDADFNHVNGLTVWEPMDVIP